MSNYSIKWYAKRLYLQPTQNTGQHREQLIKITEMFPMSN